MSTLADVPQEVQQPKHRACDECRSRKLACSKEPDGCARCKKEGSRCIYSPQKPMGRPRKRLCPDGETTQKQKDTEKPQAPQTRPRGQSPPGPALARARARARARVRAPGHSPAPAPSRAPAPVPVPAQTAAPTLTPAPAPALENEFQLDVDWSLLDSTADNMSFLDFMNLDPNQPFNPDLVSPELLSLTYPVEQSKPENKWHFGPSGMVDTLTFGSLAVDATPPSNFADNLSPVDSSPSCSAKTPSLTSDYSSPESQRPPSPTSCVCLANLYLGLDGLQRLPSNVRDSMVAARYAARVAHGCIECPSCGAALLPDAPLPIQATSNLMVLGALLPAVADAYMRIIPMVDQEVQRAYAEQRKMFFSISEFGGVWGDMARNIDECEKSHGLNGDMDPTLWRQIVRSLLKVDVYGMEDTTRTPSVNQPGLNNVVEKLESMFMQRHRLVDNCPAMQDAMNKIHFPALPPGERPTCLRIIDIAKSAISNIVIP